MYREFLQGGDLDRYDELVRDNKTNTEEMADLKKKALLEIDRQRVYHTPKPSVELRNTVGVRTQNGNNRTQIGSDQEVRVTNEKTGGQKGAKEAAFSLIPPKPIEMLARVFGKGALKYAPNNWCKGYDWTLSYDALQRHLHAYWGGEYYDSETGLPHLAHACWHTVVLQEFHDHHPELDNRWKWDNTYDYGDKKG